MSLAHFAAQKGAARAPRDASKELAGAAPFAARPPLRALVRLRWMAILAQALVIVTVRWGWDIALPVPWLLALVGAMAASNVAIARLEPSVPERAVGMVVVSDALLLTVLLALTGGPSNPFSVLYLVLVMLAAIMASPTWTWVVVAASCGGFGLLFFLHIPLPAELGGHGAHMGHAMPEQGYSSHLQGMWVAYAISAVAIGAFVSRLASSLKAEREERSRSARLLGLATLAAGAAHEIGNPLATIRVAASELEREVAARGADDEALEDLRLINKEVGRAQQVLERMAAGAGELAGEDPIPAEIEAVVERAVHSLGGDRDRVSLTIDCPDLIVRWPSQATSQALSQLMRNALQASEDGQSVECHVSADDAGVRVVVRDRGKGMSAEVLGRLGEPFFTTRSEGTGLGVFIARSLIELLGGTLSYSSEQGRGTEVVVRLPVEVTR